MCGCSKWSVCCGWGSWGKVGRERREKREKKEKKKGNLCNRTPKGKILPFRNFAFYFSNSMDFGENKLPFLHYNSDVETLPKIPSYTLTTLLVGSVVWKSHISKVQISCPLKPMT